MHKWPKTENMMNWTYVETNVGGTLLNSVTQIVIFRRLVIVLDFNVRLLVAIVILLFRVVSDLFVGIVDTCAFRYVHSIFVIQGFANPMACIKTFVDLKNSKKFGKMYNIDSQNSITSFSCI